MQLEEIVSNYSVISLSELQGLNPDFATKISGEFTGDNGTSMIDEVEVDSTGAVIEVGYRCTKANCNCVGGWMQKTGNRPYGRTLNIRTY